MTLAAGTRLGAYDILALIGAGGMGEVYRARDPRLGRDVAIKVVSSAFAADPERLHRFEQEARAAAALNHPGILAVYDLGQHDGAPFIVSELLEGETLRERLNAGALPVRKAVEYAIQIARGLAAAHEKGIVHRDLKPENVFVTADGRVKILDFGLAKLTQPEPVLAGASALPTVPADTLPGLVLGTVGYMSPEQVRGLPVDHRSDIFVLGAILYEMLSGAKAFGGETVMDSMTAILKEDPPDLPAGDRHIPPALARVVDRCLEKSPSARFQSTHDLAFALEGLSSQSGSVAALGTIQPVSRLRRFAWPAAALVGLIAGVALTSLYSRSQPSAVDAPSVRFPIFPTPQMAFSAAPGNPSQAVSPDGRRLAFVALRPGASPSLWMREFDTVEARELQGTDGAALPFWSPDGRLLAFFADGKLKKIDPRGGAPQVICEVPSNEGGTWNADNVILLGGTSGLFRVPAAGGQPVPLTTEKTPHRHPHFLPDGQHFLYVGVPSNTVYVGALDDPDGKPLLMADSKAVYAAPGYLLFVRQGTLMAQAFNADALETAGQPFSVAERIAYNPAGARAAFSVSDAGVLTSASGGAGAQSRVAWFDRGGKPLERPSPEPGAYVSLALSPNERQIALSLARDIWLVDVARGVLSRFTTDSANDDDPIWSPDSSRLVFDSGRRGNPDLFEKSLDGSDEKLLVGSDQPEFAEDWSQDGRFIAYISLNGRRFFILPLFGDRKPFLFLDTPFTKDEPHFSADGRWLAYFSAESGRAEVYVQPFPGPGERVRISTNGGSQPRWRKDGRELFYLSLDGKLMTVALKAGSTLDAGVPKVLFQTPIATINVTWDQYDVTADGQRFVVLAPVEGGTPQSPITVITNWTAGLKK